LLDLILKDITDINIRENFFRLTKFLNSQVLFDGKFEFFDIDIPLVSTSYEIKHGLKFIPVDIILLNVEGDFNYYFEYQNFTRTSIFVTTSGPTRLRFLAGKLTKQGKTLKEQYPLVPPLIPATLPPPTATSVPRLIETFDTTTGTAVGDLVRVTGTDFVEKISDNTAATIPNGIFGICYYKPTTIRADVLFIGLVTGFSGFTAGSPLFISTSGVPTHTVPLTGMVQQIGFATRANEFFLQMMQPMRRS
jgi:hypothetical protein